MDGNSALGAKMAAHGAACHVRVLLRTLMEQSGAMPVLQYLPRLPALGRARAPAHAE